jgi:ketosteroid isomerase-like protein
MAARPQPPAHSRTRRFSPSRVALCLVLAAMLPATGLVGCGDARADADAIRTLVTKETAAINGKDIHALSEIWSQDKDILMFDVPPPGRFRGWEQIGHLWKDFFDRVSDLHLAVDKVQAQAQGSLGYATYDWSMTGRLGSYSLEDRGQATAIYRKEGGQWRLIHAHYSPVPAALAGQEKTAGAAAPSPGATPGPARPAAAGAAKPTPAASPAAAASPASSQAPKTP